MVLLRYSNLGPLSRVSFDSTAPTGRLPDPDSRELFRAALESARKFAEDPQGWLVFTGPGGAGKTHLAAAIANRCIENGQTVFFMFVPDFLDHLRGAYSPESTVSYDDLFQQVRNAPVLVLDDLGSHSSTPWAQEKLFQVFNHRFNALLPTVITVRGPLQLLDEGIRTRIEAEGTSIVRSLGRRRPEPLQEVGGLQEDMLKEMTFEKFKVGQDVRATEHQRDTLK
ncbi:MAG: ATP-binding protein, partial [Dehalococcoidia bacterium]|nr:ATP-binding protein [Dehalococcoidia bacterium]